MSSKANKHNDVDKESLRLEFCFDRGINFKDRIIQITGEIVDQATFDYLDAAMTEMERGTKKGITIKINSPGGSVYEALAMVGRIERSKCHVTTECYGHAMSAASLLLIAGDKRIMSRRAWFMHHEISTGARGTVTEMKEFIQQISRELDSWAECMADYSSESKEFWLKAAHKQDFYLNAEECLKLGIVDELF
jgi:ATP-dependent Clp endopeptidase proteolytic subunit ClpP